MRLAFGECILDLDRRELQRDGAPVHLRAKVFDVLSHLIVNRDRLVTRDELLAHAWPSVTVSDATLSSCIRTVRQAIGEARGEQKYLKTLRGQGFRFVAEVTEAASAQQSERTPPPEPVTTLERDQGLAIAVLPFANLSQDSKLDWLADGLAEDITTALSRFKAFTVISASSSFQYRKPDRDVAAIAAELDVDYIIEGSVRCGETEFRATARLTQASTDQHIWANNYDGLIENLFSVQDNITRTIATRIKPEIDLAEIRRAATRSQTGTLRAQEMAWQARALLDRARMEKNPSFMWRASRSRRKRRTWIRIAGRPGGRSRSATS